MKKSSLIIFVSLIILIGLFVSRPQGPKLPIVIDEYNGSSSPEVRPDITNIGRFSDNVTTKSATNVSGKRPGPAPTPLPYPRISLNYSVQLTSSIRDNKAGANKTFAIITLDIRNYGYKYFDAHPNNFRALLNRDEEVRPSVNISTGNTIDAVIPNNSRAKGDLLFSIDKKKSIAIIYSPVNKSESYYIIYKILSQSQMEDKKEEKKDDDDDEKEYR